MSQTISLTFSPSLSGGTHDRTKYDSSKGTITVEKAPVISTFPGDWDTTGLAWTIVGDKATLNNTNSGNNYLSKIHNVNQTVAAPVKFRVRCSGVNVASPASSGFSIHLGGSYNVAGGAEDISFETFFPAGTFDETQFTVTFTPAQPIKWFYVYVFARNKTGQITVRNLQLIDESTSRPDAKSGSWSSDPIDLVALANQSITDPTGNMQPKHVGFYYGDPANVNAFNSIETATNTFSKFHTLITKEPGELTARQLQAITDTIAKGTKVFGYTHLGDAPGIPATTDADVQGVINRCVASGYYGVFFDMAGYDFHVTRTRFNTLTQYAHTAGLKVMGNAWIPADILASTVEATYNPGGVATLLAVDDWVLLESFLTTSNNVYAGASDFSDSMQKYLTTKSLASPLNVKVCGLAYHMNTRSINDMTDRNISYLLSLLLGLDGWSYGTTSADNVLLFTDIPSTLVGATYSDTVKYVSDGRWERNTNLGCIWFKATASPLTREAGVFSTGVSTAPTTTFSIAAFIATLTTLTWKTSADKITWTSWTLGTTPSRYIMATALLNN